MRPTRIRRKLGRPGRGKDIVVQVIAASREQQVFTLCVPAPSLIWVHGRRSGDMMIDGVPDVRAAEGVRPLNLSGKSTQHSGGGDRKTKGAGRRHQRMYGQGTYATHV